MTRSIDTGTDDLLARTDAKSVAVLGTGVQGRTQLRAVCTVRAIEKVFVFDTREDAAEAFRDEMSDIIDADVDSFLARYREITGYSEEQVNPAVMTYFLVLGVIGVVSQLAASGSAMARGDSSSTIIAFNHDNLIFGQGAWMDATMALEAILDGGD